MLAWRYLSKTKEDNMKINKEKEVKTEIHKKNNGKIHKRRMRKLTTGQRQLGKEKCDISRRMAESVITENVEGSENIEESLEVTGIAIRPVKGAISEGNRIRKR